MGPSDFLVRWGHFANYKEHKFERVVLHLFDLCPIFIIIIVQHLIGCSRGGPRNSLRGRGVLGRNSSGGLGSRSAGILIS